MGLHIGKALQYVLLAGTVACGSSTGPNTHVVGIYTLRSIDGHELPVASHGVTVVSSEIILDLGGRFSRTVTSSITLNGSTVISAESETGAWRVSGSVITLDLGSAGSARTGTVRNDGIDLQVSSELWNHQRCIPCLEMTSVPHR